jgi:hypothetical protein
MSPKKRSNKDLKRPKPVKAEFPIVLIVCEDGVSSPQYFSFLGRQYRISPKIRVCGEECGSAPIDVVKFTKSLVTKRKLEKGMPQFESKWCVFDTEGVQNMHQSLFEAIDMANSNHFSLAISNPCFEFWYLLHFNYTTKPAHDCTEMITFLEEKFPAYDKGDNEIFEVIFPKTEDAIRYARRISEEHFTGVDIENRNPSTEVYKLVEYLKSISNLP